MTDRWKDALGNRRVPNDAEYSHKREALYATRWSDDPHNARYEVLGGEFERWLEMEFSGAAYGAVRDKYLLYGMMEYAAACRDADHMAPRRDWTKLRVEVRGQPGHPRVEIVTIQNRRIRSEVRKASRGQWAAKVWRPGRTQPFRIFMWP